jgi:agmatinase
MEIFDPNEPATADSNIFGLPYALPEAELVILPIPWDVTVSYKEGASKGPAAVFDASKQVDLFLRDVPQAWNAKIAMGGIPKAWKKKNKALRKLAIKYLDEYTSGNVSERAMHARDQINAESRFLNEYLRNEALQWIGEGKLVAVLGGDHSTPLGLVQALAETHSAFSILQIDAHCDLRNAYEGFTYSHASISHNYLTLPQVERLTQVGIRDLCQQEFDAINAAGDRVKVYYDEDMQAAMSEGQTWNQIQKDIVNSLGEKVYISFDIDGLSPELCPNTGTPVPGGLSFWQAQSLIREIAASGRKIIGFDLVEVAPGADEWDANVGARILFRMAHECIRSNRTSKKEKIPPVKRQVKPKAAVNKSSAATARAAKATAAKATAAKATAAKATAGMAPKATTTRKVTKSAPKMPVKASTTKTSRKTSTGTASGTAGATARNKKA